VRRRTRAGIVIGHGPHYSLPAGVHKGEAIFYGLGNSSHDTGHGGRRHGDWLGMVVRGAVGQNSIEEVGFRFVRHTEGNETYWSDMDKEAEELADLAKRSVAYGAKIERNGHEVRVGAVSGSASLR
jgi:poly-gamma-glutamate capsule biosynthesis protein CapA/YwtB (metallophosphatase superfamily)